MADPGGEAEGALLPDTHAHLDVAEFAEDLHDVLARAQDAGVQQILAVGTNLASSTRAVQIGSKYEHVYVAVGVHPHEAGLFEQEAQEIKALLNESKVIAVGEIGLDYLRDWVSRDIQRQAFEQQLEWAHERALPVSIHNRQADKDILEAVEGAGVTPVLHCFSGSDAFARQAISLGCYLGFAGTITFPRESGLRDVAARVPLDRCLLETDSPVLAPQTWRGKRNEPAYVTATLQTFATCRRMQASEAERVMSRNAAHVFRWSEA